MGMIADEVPSHDSSSPECSSRIAQDKRGGVPIAAMPRRKLTDSAGRTILAATLGMRPMTTHEQNDFLSLTGPGTPMGALMRRYWIPALLSSEIPEPDCPPVRLKL